MAYGENTVVLTTLTNLTAFHPKSGAKSNQVMDKPDNVAEESSDAAKSAPYTRGTRTQYHDKNTPHAYVSLANKPKDEKRKDKSTETVSPTQELPDIV